MSDMTPEERVRRVKAALAEAGYPDAPVWIEQDRIHFESGVIPRAVAWRAAAVVGDTHKCWPCFDADPHAQIDCPHDPLTSPWPEVVR